LVVEKFSKALIQQMQQYRFPGKELMLTTWHETLPDQQPQGKKKSPRKERNKK